MMNLQFFIPVISLTLLAASLGILIVIVSKTFHVEEDPLVGLVTKILPGVNCGACGFPGCAQFAQYMVTNRDPSKTCPPGGADVSAQIGQALGIKIAETKPVVASVRCQGITSVTVATADYQGTRDCWVAKQAFHGPKVCPYSCFGFGSCISACKYHALKVVEGVIQVDATKCTGCGACVQECPVGVLEMHEKKSDRYVVACSSTDKGGAVKKYCKVGCTGCTKCQKVCEFEAIKVENFLSRIDQDKCTGCGKCIEVCPTKSIVLKHDLVKAQTKHA